MENGELVKKIERVMERLSIYREKGLYQSESICLQLEWIRDRLLGKETKEKPGPFSMGIIATREFDMWGNEPELASEINEIERIAELKPECQVGRVHGQKGNRVK